MTFFESSSRSIFLFEHDLRANASRLSRGKTGTHFSGSCSNLRNDVRRDLVFDEGDEVAQRCGSLWKEYRPCQPGLQASVVVTQKFSLFRRPVHHVKFEPKAHWNHEFPARPQIRTSPGRCSRGGGLRIRTMRVPWSRFVTYDTQYDTAIFDTHRQIRRLVYSRPSASNLNPTEEVSYGNSGSSR